MTRDFKMDEGMRLPTPTELARQSYLRCRRRLVHRSDGWWRWSRKREGWLPTDAYGNREDREVGEAPSFVPIDQRAAPEEPEAETRTGYRKDVEG